MGNQQLPQNVCDDRIPRTPSWNIASRAFPTQLRKLHCTCAKRVVAESRLSRRWLISHQLACNSCLVVWNFLDGSPKPVPSQQHNHESVLLSARVIRVFSAPQCYAYWFSTNMWT
eukprot:1191279-Prorocentrum_minimum.AAC.4